MKSWLKIFFGCLILVTINNSCYYTTEKRAGIDNFRINGVSLEGSRSPINHDFYDEIKNVNGNWVSLMPYAYSEAGDTKLTFKNLKWQWWGEGAKGVRSCVDLAHKSNINVMLKPHLWSGHNQFTGDLKMNTEEDWQSWEKSYREYIMLYANIADSLNVEMFCIGTELENFVLERTPFWNSLIEEIREFYDGKITYAANWNEYPKVPFWDKLDFIGIDAYFPLSDDKNPPLDTLISNWNPWKEEMLTVKNKFNKQILFTEYGYQSVEYCTVTPWSANQGGAVSDQEQRNAYAALYESCWDEDWIAGGFLWKWHVPEHNPQSKESRFTPQYKPALDVIKEWYKK